MFSAKSIAILGVTGSIGQNTRDVVLSAPEKFSVSVVTAQSDAQGLAREAKTLKAACAIIGDKTKYAALKEALAGSGIEARAGVEALEHAVPSGTDITMSAITGMAGLKPLLHAIKNSKVVAIANKEPLVSAGAIVMALAGKCGCKILPVDSEHNAIFQVFDFENKNAIEKIILTASGGPFREWSLERIAKATPAQALAHPTWSMGKKISIDSASMMNKALEVIEAHVLFGMKPEQIEVLVHPQSIVHSMVEYADGSVLAQLGASDMRTPITHALAWPQRMSTPGQRLDFTTLKSLDFEAPDLEKFPALGLAYACLRQGDTAALTMNAANEVAVEAFLQGSTDFLGIMRVVEYALERRPKADLRDIEAVLDADALVRRQAGEFINQHQGRSALKTVR